MVVVKLLLSSLLVFYSCGLVNAALPSAYVLKLYVYYDDDQHSWSREKENMEKRKRKSKGWNELTLRGGRNGSYAKSLDATFCILDEREGILLGHTKLYRHLSGFTESFNCVSRLWVYWNFFSKDRAALSTLVQFFYVRVVRGKNGRKIIYGEFFLCQPSTTHCKNFYAAYTVL